jgi:6,7-dimethyl-8-ribityllumazine synthase
MGMGKAEATMTATQTSLSLPEFDRPVKLLIVAAIYDRAAADTLIADAKDVAALAEVEVLEVPGALEVPVAIAMAERMAEYDGYIALACVTGTGAEMVVQESWRSISLLGLQGACVGNGISVTPQDGGHAAFAALHLVAISRRWTAQTKGIGFRV